MTWKMKLKRHPIFLTCLTALNWIKKRRAASVKDKKYFILNAYIAPNNSFRDHQTAHYSNTSEIKIQRVCEGFQVPRAARDSRQKDPKKSEKMSIAAILQQSSIKTTNHKHNVASIIKAFKEEGTVQEFFTLLLQFLQAKKETGSAETWLKFLGLLFKELFEDGFSFNNNVQNRSRLFKKYFWTCC